jgi:hypothetical protein
MSNMPLEDVSTESDQLAAPLEGGWVRSGFFKVGFDASQDFKMEVITAVLCMQVFWNRLIC